MKDIKEIIKLITFSRVRQCLWVYVLCFSVYILRLLTYNHTFSSERFFEINRLYELSSFNHFLGTWLIVFLFIILFSVLTEQGAADYLIVIGYSRKKIYLSFIILLLLSLILWQISIFVSTIFLLDFSFTEILNYYVSTLLITLSNSIVIVFGISATRVASEKVSGFIAYIVYSALILLAPSIITIIPFMKYLIPNPYEILEYSDMAIDPFLGSFNNIGFILHVFVYLLWITIPLYLIYKSFQKQDIQL